MKYEQIKNEKKLTKLQRDRLNKIYQRMNLGVATKQELMSLINVKDERIVRDCISYIKKFYPVISLSGAKGYRIAKTIDDLEDAKHAINAETGRANDIVDGVVELKKFVMEMEGRNEKSNIL